MSNSTSKTRPLKPILFIVGPTASGKSGLAMEVARSFNGEIICADSQTIKKYLDIGTAKPTAKDRAEVAHHLIDIIDPYESFNVAQFKELAKKAIVDIESRDKMPIVVGGSGLYIDSILYNFEFRPTTFEFNRQELNNKTVAELQDIIKSKHLKLPNNPANPRHLIRTIESGGLLSQKSNARDNSLIIGINPEKEVLEDRIIKRVRIMFEQGFVDEVIRVISKFGRVPEKFDAIGYSIVQRLIDGEIKIQEAEDLFIIAHRQYAKRQRSWFRRNSDIVWFDSAEEAFEYIKKCFTKTA